MKDPITIDLFCGAGGITEGFRQAGFICIFANDNNLEALAHISHMAKNSVL
ncbi:MAG: DNA cytosine methyltransferase [Chloroflexi bacterium]|nr:DNA cytosine methyltransferase [Chloroflexota bacterium]